MLEQRIEHYINYYHLFSKDDKLLVALSGGTDSVALLLVLLDLGYKCEAAHCNFHLRGDESDRDENFVRELCLKKNLKLNIVHFETKKYAESKHISIEMAARDLRYDWFEKIRIKTNSQYIAVAHHRDDSVETFLLNLVRGAGINGLKGIAPKNGYIVRPMLEVTRNDIFSFLKRRDQEYVTDSTNLQDDYMRNKIRLNVMPLLCELNPSASQKIAETSNILSDVAVVYNHAIEMSKKEVMIDGNIVIDKLLSQLSPKNLLFEILHPLGFNSSQINDIYASINSEPGKCFFSEKYKILRDRYLFIISENNPQDLPKLSVEYLDIDNNFQVPKEKNICVVDADKLKGELSIRRYKAGDKFIPYGMKGRKKISDYLTDRKFSLFDKENQCVVCCGEDIIWLVNERSDDRYKVSNETKRVAILRCNIS